MTAAARPPALARLLAAAALALLAACSSVPEGPAPPPDAGGLPASAAANEVALTALNYLDVRYRAGGASAAEGFDCSGFTRHVYASALGIDLPRRAEDQALRTGWPEVGIDALRTGDLVFFNTLRRRHSHVGIYLGGGRFIHSPSAGSQVRIDRLQQAYWATRFDGARRLPQDAAIVGAEASP